MDSYLRILSFIAFFLTCTFLDLVNSQMSAADLTYIKNFLKKSQEENGLYGKSLENTYKAIYTLKALDGTVEHIPKICREISFEAMNGLNLNILQIDELLGCKLPTVAPQEILEENLANLNLETLYKTILTAEKTGAKLNWPLLLENLKTFLTEEKLFASNAGLKTSSLLSTAHGLDLLNSIHSKVTNNNTTKAELEDLIVNVVQAVYKEFTLIREDIGLFSEDGVSTIRLNSEFASSLASLRSFVNIENYDGLLTKILNYLVTFKYDYSGIDSIYYLIKGINTLNDLPLLTLKKKVFDYVEDTQAEFKLLNGLGKEVDQYKVFLEYSLKEEEEEKSKGEYDLEDEPKEVQTYKKEFSKTSDVSLDLSNLVKTSGKFSLKINAKFENLNTQSSFEQSYLVDMVSFTKVKLNHLKLSVTNTGDKNDEKEITVEHPKRTFKNFKATQNSVIKVRVKFNNAENKQNKIEQVFLRLRHVELGKSYTAYVSEYKGADDYHNISFDLSDSNYMDAFDGTYELTLIVSDIGLENPVIWNFGKVEVKFKKALDPSGLHPSYKNIQKDKMEPHFPAEESPNKNLVSSLIFCGLIFAVLGYYLIHLKTNRVNLSNFPRADKSAFFFSLAFMVFLLSMAYLIVLFFVKLNIIQTLVAFLVLGLPGAFVTYKALAKLTIEV